MPTHRLPAFLRLNDARKNKGELLASLTPFEVELLDTVVHGRGHVFGGKGSQSVVVLRGKQEKVVEDGMTTVNSLVRTGWLRFARMPGVGESGYFWLTDSAERLWDVLGR